MAGTVAAVTSALDAMAEGEEGPSGESDADHVRSVREDFAELAAAADSLSAAAARLAVASRRVASTSD